MKNGSFHWITSATALLAALAAASALFLAPAATGLPGQAVGDGAARPPAASLAEQGAATPATT